MELQGHNAKGKDMRRGRELGPFCNESLTNCNSYYDLGPCNGPDAVTRCFKWVNLFVPKSMENLPVSILLFFSLLFS